MILRCRWIVPISSPCIDYGAIVVHQDKVVDFGPAPLIEAKHSAHPLRDFPDAVIMPGFVNVHTHLELTALRGYLEDLPFWDWIRKLTHTKYQVLSYDDIAISALLGAVEAIRAGITTVADPMDLGASVDAVLASGLRSVLYQECFSPRPAEAEQVLAGLKEKLTSLRRRIRHWPAETSLSEVISHPRLCTPEDWEQRRHRLQLGLSPHSPYTVSAKLFRKVKAYSDAEGLRLCIHAAESAAESDLLEHGTGPIMQSYLERGIDWIPPGCSSLQYLDQLGVVQDKTLLVHCVRLDLSDFDLIESRNARVAHCPKSNWKLGHGYMNLSAMSQRNIQLGLGSDSTASNNSLDFFEEMRFALFNPSWQIGHAAKPPMAIPPAHAILRLATLGGASALGLSSEIGSIETGKQADLIVVDLSQPHVRPVYSPITTLVCSAKASDVRMTMIGGEIVFDEGRVIGVDEKLLCRRIEAIREKILNAASQN
jgi:5-methylthioadenosine/S-adenosylhomocysteine deaminase